MTPSFIADVHLGKLAKLLRMLGFDCMYSNHYSNHQLEEIAALTSRILLSRNTSFQNIPPAHSFIINEEDPVKQLKQVLASLHLQKHIRPFTRCIACNGHLQTTTKEQVRHLLQQNTITNYDSYWQCTNCLRVFWQGGHWQRMNHFISHL